MDASIISQFRMAARHRPAALLGAALGGVVPLLTYTVAHAELEDWLDPRAAIVVGGLAYSAKTVWQWGRRAFDCPWKATGFVLLLEGVMVASTVPWLAQLALGYLICINACATACQIARDDQPAPEPVAKVIAPPVKAPRAEPVLILPKKPGRPSNAARAAASEEAAKRMAAKLVGAT